MNYESVIFVNFKFWHLSFLCVFLCVNKIWSRVVGCYKIVTYIQQPKIRDICTIERNEELCIIFMILYSKY